MDYSSCVLSIFVMLKKRSCSKFSCILTAYSSMFYSLEFQIIEYYQLRVKTVVMESVLEIVE